MQTQTRYNFNINSFQMEEITGPIQKLDRFWYDSEYQALLEGKAELLTKQARLNRELRDVKEGLNIVNGLLTQEGNEN